MKKLTLILPLCLIGLAGCDNMGGPGYGAAPAATQTVETGTIIRVRTVQVAGANTTAGGAIAGGLAGAVIGHQIGEGSGKALATGAGAIGGAILGQKMAENMAQPRLSRQWTVRLDAGGTIQVIQDGNNMYVGQHVRVVQSSKGTYLQPY
jgi:outer membrane lipoprotein SlyB